MTIAYLVFLGVLGIVRVAELVRSKKNWQHHRNYAEMSREALFPWMVALHSSFFVLLPLEMVLRKPVFGGPLTIAALVVTLLALVLRIWTLKTMGKSWNVRIVNAPDYPIVSSGPYRFVRHPNYLVVFLELLAIPLIAHLVFSALILTIGNLVVLSLRIRNEEAVLARNPAWREKMAGKPRFLPFLF